MRKYLAWIAGAALAALATTWLVAQPVIQNTLSGNECWNAGQGAGGPTAGFVCSNMVRGGTPQTVLSAVTGNVTIGQATGNFTQTGTPSMVGWASTGGNVLVNAQPSAGTWTWPASPVGDGAIVGVCNVTASAFTTNALTPAANTGQTMNTTAVFTTLAAGACVRYQYNLSQLTWYRVQ